MIIDIKKSLGLLVVFISSAFLFFGCDNSSGSQPSSGLHSELAIKSVVYDNNRTDSVLDDSLYIYFSKSINFDSIKNDVNSSFSIIGEGSIGNLISSADYNDALFHRLKISLGQDATQFVPEVTKIALSKDSVMKDVFNLDNSQVVVTAFRPILKTGQINSSIAYDDGASQNGITRNYTPNADGTVRDNVTGLIWEQADDDTPKNWSDANGYCSTLTKGSLNWRLPSIDELIQLADKGRNYPSIGNEFAAGTKNSQYWSLNDKVDKGAEYAWSLHFDKGLTNSSDKNETLYVRCVSSSANGVNKPDYIRDDLNKIVIDTSTNLIWQDTADADMKTWNEAVSQCENLVLDNKSDWRLPNFNELDSITDKSIYNPAMNPEFINKDLSAVWSSTTDDSNSSNAWYSSFWCGCNYIHNKITMYNVRCVRSAD